MGAEFGREGAGTLSRGWSLSVTPRQICAQALQWMEEPVCLGSSVEHQQGAPPSPQAERGRTLVRDEDTVWPVTWWAWLDGWGRGNAPLLPLSPSPSRPLHPRVAYPLLTKWKLEEFRICAGHKHSVQLNNNPTVKAELVLNTKRVRHSVFVQFFDNSTANKWRFVNLNDKNDICKQVIVVFSIYSVEIQPRLQGIIWFSVFCPFSIDNKAHFLYSALNIFPPIRWVTNALHPSAAAPASSATS